jgi:hypothetical protein
LFVAMARQWFGRLALASALLGGSGGCSGEAPPTGSGSSMSASQALAHCGPFDASACSVPGPSFAKDIQPLLDRDCNTCHTLGSTLWPLTGYQDVRDWVGVIVPDVEGCMMPPLDGGTTMSSADRALLLDWVACGALNN